MSTLVFSTLLYAFLSAGFRGMISIIDRKLFGHQKLNIRRTNLTNNLLATLFMTFVALNFSKATVLLEKLLDFKVCLFALTLQLTAYAFSFGFKNMKVHHVILASKGADLFIPFAILIFAKQWTFIDSLFSFFSFLACFPIILFKKNFSKIHWLSAGLIILILSLQGGLSPLLLSSHNSNFSTWISLTFALVCWRSLWSLFFSVGAKQTAQAQKHSMIQSKSLLILRAILTVSAQLFLVLAVGKGIASLAWPILNSTGIISLLLASLLLNEKASKPELLSMLFIVLLAIFRGFL